MNEMIKIWLENLYKKEIAETEADIRNHTLWRLGAKNKEEEQTETGIIINLYEYIDVLKELKEQLKNKSKEMNNMLAETVTGYVGQILDEGEFDEHTHKLLQELYNIALKEIETGKEE